MAADADQKTEEPTPRRLERAAKDGEVWQPKELAPAVALAVAALLLAVGGGGAWMALAEYLAASLASAGDAAADPDAALALHIPAAVPLAAAGASAIAALLSGLAVSRGIAWQRLAPKFNRLNPVAGLARLFSREGATSAAVALAKLIAFAAAAYALFAPSLPNLLRLDGGIAGAGQTVAAAIARLALFAAFGLAAIAVFEGVTSFNAFRRKLRMTPDEVRRERRQDEGAPELKAQIRRTQIATASRRMRTTMADATVVIVNPMHFAVAMRYHPGTDAAPVLVEKGREITAQAIRDVARELNIPIVRAPRLARAVFFTGRIGDTVREELFGAVAVVIAYVLSFDDAALPTVPVPPAFDFDETGARRKPGDPAPL